MQVWDGKTKTKRMGKGIRSWLVTWLPSLDALNLVLLLTFWGKDMSLHEDLNCGTHTAYKAIALGSALMIKFPEVSPLRYDDFLQLCEINLEVRKAMKSDSACASDLPTLSKLRAWGQRHLKGVHVITEPGEVLQHAEGARYTHHSHEQTVTERAQYCHQLAVCETPMPSTSQGEPPEDGNFSSYLPARRRPSMVSGDFWRKAAATAALRSSRYNVGEFETVPPMECECTVDRTSVLQPQSAYNLVKPDTEFEKCCVRFFQLCDKDDDLHLDESEATVFFEHLGVKQVSIDPEKGLPMKDAIKKGFEDKKLDFFEYIFQDDFEERRLVQCPLCDNNMNKVKKVRADSSWRCQSCQELAKNRLLLWRCQDCDLSECGKCVKARVAPSQL